MLAVLALPLLARSKTVRSLIPTPPLPVPTRDRLATQIVAAVWVGMLIFQMIVVTRTISRVPYFDEYCNLHLLFADASPTWRDFWRQHNEHRIPLPKLVYVAVTTAAGYDFRAEPVVNTVLMALATAGLLYTARAVRGRTIFADAALPAFLMHMGHWENLVYGFQIQFILSTVLLLAVIGLAVSRKLPYSVVRTTGLGLSITLLPFCGANGVGLVPALSVALLVMGALGTRSGERDRRWPGVIAIAFGLIGLALVPVYFLHLERVNHLPKSHDILPIIRAVSNFAGMCFGATSLALQPTGYEGPTAVGLLTCVLVAATVVMLIRAVLSPDQRIAAILLLGVIGGMGCLGLGIGYGRGEHLIAASRYVTLATPLAVALYFAWAFASARASATGLSAIEPSLACQDSKIFFRWRKWRSHDGSLKRERRASTPDPSIAGWVPVGLMVVGLLSFWPNSGNGIENTRWTTYLVKRVDREIRLGMPITFVVDRNVQLYPRDRPFLRAWFLKLREKGLPPFDQLKDDPSLSLEPVALSGIRIEGLTDLGDGWYRLDRPSGGLVLRLPRTQPVYGLRLEYEADFPLPNFPLSMLSWDLEGRSPPRPGFGIIGQLEPTTERTSTCVYVDRETNSFRIDLIQPGTRIRIHGLALMHPASPR